MITPITATLRGDDSQFDTEPICFRTGLPAIPEIGQVIQLGHSYSKKLVKVISVVWIVSGDRTDNFELDVRVTDASK